MPSDFIKLKDHLEKCLNELLNHKIIRQMVVQPII